jgi:uncharacterized protein (TIGR02646 family)
MKLIDKTLTEASKNARIALHNWRDTYESESGKTFKDYCDEDASTGIIWALLTDGLETDDFYNKAKLRKALFDEQREICCYCGCSIKLAKGKTAIEHFLAKMADKFKNTYNYDNLMLSCEGFEAHAIQDYFVQKGDTWKLIADKFEMVVQKLQQDNPTEFTKNEQPRVNARLTITKPPTFCDNQKGEKTDVIIDPKQKPDCWDRLIYKSDGSISCDEKDEIAKKTIEILNLNAITLVKKRQKAWKDARAAFDSDGICQLCIDTDDFVGLLQRTNDLYQQMFNDTFHLCVVHRAYLKQQIE